MSLNNFETIKFEIKGEIGFLTINRPDKLNALNIKVLQELKAATAELVKMNLKGLILTGEGEKAFVAGADIAEMKPMTVGEAHAFSHLGQLVTLGFEALPYPTIAAVNGFALGGGFEMALSCDFIFASEKAVFGLPEVKLGLIPGFGGTQRLAKLVGASRAKELVFSGRQIKAQESKDLGIALEIYADKDQLLASCEAWFENTKKNSPMGISKAKLALSQGIEKSLEQGLMIERQEFGNIFATEDMKEGTSAFVEKRTAYFKGK